MRAGPDRPAGNMTIGPKTLHWRLDAYIGEARNQRSRSCRAIDTSHRPTRPSANLEQKSQRKPQYVIGVKT
jgi:hypothetical protein